MSDIAVSFSRKAYDPNDTEYKGFVRKVGHFQDLAPHLTKAVWSPIVWKDGQRAKLNFLTADLLSLDFDDGLSLDDGINFCKEAGLAAIIGTTRSHQKEKRTALEVKPPCDRFRMIVAAERCTDIHSYEYTNSVFMDNMACDKSCKDGARLFFPCSEIVWSCFEGKKIKWLEAPPYSPPPQRDYQGGEMSGYVRDLINNGSMERHKACFIVGARLGKQGFTETDIIEKILRGPMAAIGREDIARAVRNGMAATGRSY